MKKSLTLLLTVTAAVFAISLSTQNAQAQNTQSKETMDKKTDTQVPEGCQKMGRSVVG